MGKFIWPNSHFIGFRDSYFFKPEARKLVVTPQIPKFQGNRVMTDSYRNTIHRKDPF